MLMIGRRGSSRHLFKSVHRAREGAGWKALKVIASEASHQWNQRADAVDASYVPSGPGGTVMTKIVRP